MREENVFGAASIQLGKILYGKEVSVKFTERAQDEVSRELWAQGSEHDELLQKVKMAHEHLWRASVVIAVLVVPGEVTASIAGKPTCGDEGSKMIVSVKAKEVAEAGRLLRRPFMGWSTENQWRNGQSVKRIWHSSSCSGLGPTTSALEQCFGWVYHEVKLGA